MAPVFLRRRSRRCRPDLEFLHSFAGEADLADQLAIGTELVVGRAGTGVSADLDGGADRRLVVLFHFLSIAAQGENGEQSKGSRAGEQCLSRGKSAFNSCGVMAVSQ